MAEQVETRVVDDLDKTIPADKRAVLGFNDVVVSLDLSTPNFEHLTELLEPFLKAGRILPGVNLVREEVQRRIDPARIRIWAQREGYPVMSRGRIPAEVEDAYIKAEVEQITQA